MKRISQEEIYRILEMHSKLKKPLISEQVEGDLKSKLTKMITDGCVKNGEIVSMQTKTPALQLAIKQESTKTPGKYRYFFSDGRGGSYENGKFQFFSGKLDCEKVRQATLDSKNVDKQNTVNTDIARELEQYGWKKRENIAVTDTELSQLYQKHPKYDLFKLKVNTAKTGGYTPEQTAFIENWKTKGYKSTLTPDEIAQGTFQKVKVSGSENYFPEGLIMYKPGKETYKFEKSECKDKIKEYYDYWTRKSVIGDDISQQVFEKLKSEVQWCANKYNNKWGGIFSKVDEYIDILRGVQVGDIKGPLSSGGDSEWRLK
jgi:hypothetical protein